MADDRRQYPAGLSEGPINISRNTAETNIGISSPLIPAARRCGRFLQCAGKTGKE
jgi:hypothetical protein